MQRGSILCPWRACWHSRHCWSGITFVPDAHFIMQMCDATTCQTLQRMASTCEAQINSVQTHPMDPNLVLTASNDHTAQISDVRRLSTAVASSSGSSAGALNQLPSLPSLVSKWPLAEFLRVCLRHIKTCRDHVSFSRVQCSTAYC